MVEKLGRWAFIIAAILALLAGAIPALGQYAAVGWVLIILGVVVGFLNVTERESTGFLVAAIALIIAMTSVSNIFSLFWGGTTLQSVLNNVVLVISPAAIIVAVKHLYVAAQD
jgi:hypothetical protein